MVDKTPILHRNDLPCLLPAGSIAAELGTARGDYSARLLSSNKIERLYSIDRWAGDRGHNDAEFRRATEKLKQFGDRSVIVRLSFHDAVELFDNEFFDFIYVDGYAHTGQEQGQTLWEWWPKLKHGGMFSGHDYDEAWPLTIKFVDKFVSDVGLELRLTEETSGCKSWYVKKPWKPSSPTFTFAIVGEAKTPYLLDAPCGDFYWMQFVDLGGVHYIGIDVVDQLIESNCRGSLSGQPVKRRMMWLTP